VTHPPNTRHRTRAEAVDKPAGRDAVMAALVEATSELILEQGVTMSVREIAQRAGVNHGLVHTYFGSKDALVTAAFGSITDRAAAEVDETGFPPPDLAFRRGGEVARALARVMLDVGDDPFPTHPILPAWRRALAADRPGSMGTELDEAVIVAATLGLGWALFANHLCGILGVDAEQADVIEHRVLTLVSEIGGLPGSDASGSSAESSSD